MEEWREGVLLFAYIYETKPICSYVNENFPKEKWTVASFYTRVNEGRTLSKSIISCQVFMSSLAPISTPRLLNEDHMDYCVLHEKSNKYQLTCWGEEKTII